MGKTTTLAKNPETRHQTGHSAGRLVQDAAPTMHVTMTAYLISSCAHGSTTSSDLPSTQEAKIPTNAAPADATNSLSGIESWLLASQMA
jgi:hypothetical protein